MGASKIARAAKRAPVYPPAYVKFWMGLEVSSAKLVLFRALFFGVFAIDAWLQIAHAPRYGYGDFNVGHFALLDAILPMPTRTSMLLIYGAQAYLGARIMLGGVHRAFYIALAALFAYGYFISQLNSYQHHYLLAIALGLAAAFPWPSLQHQNNARPAEQRARNWPVRMLLVAMSVMYVYAALAKLDGEWTDGSTLRVQLQPGFIRDTAAFLGWAFTAKLAIFAELALAGLIHWRRAWPLALVLGIGMHMSFHWAGLKIGLFSYFMITLYALVLPETWLAYAVARLKRVGPVLQRGRALLDGRAPRAWIASGLGLAGGLGLVQLLPVDSRNALTVVIAVLAAAGLLLRWRRPAPAGVQHLVACALLVLLAHQTDAVRDYYRFLGGNERRAGNYFEAMMAYEKVVQVAPDYAPGHRSLGDLYRRLDRDDDALASYRVGLAIDPEDYALNRGAAQIFHKRGQGKEALAAAERALASRPKEPSMRAIREHWKRELRINAP